MNNMAAVRRTTEPIFTHRRDAVVLQVQNLQRLQFPAQPQGDVLDAVVGQVQVLQTGQELQSLNPPEDTTAV